MSVRVRMYSTASCPYCTRAERLLTARGVESIDMLRVDLNPSLRQEMIRTTGRRTVPQIFFDDTHIGGYEDLAALDREGKLPGLLQT
jgi:glutaredoxin 3